MARVRLPKSMAALLGHQQKLRPCRRKKGAPSRLRKDPMSGRSRTVRFAPEGGEVGHHPRCPRVTVARIPRRRKDLAVARPTYISLRYLKQQPGEPLREYIRRFRQVEDGIRGLPAASVITAFYLNVRSARVREAMAARWVHTVAELYALAHECARAKEVSNLWATGGRWLAISGPGAALQPMFVGPGSLGRPVEQKNSFVIKIGRSEDGSHTVSVDLDVTAA